MAMISNKLLVTVILAILFPFTINAANILGLFAHPSESHFNVMQSIMTELARRENTITIFSSHRLSEPIKNLKEVVIEPEFPFWQELQKKANIQSGGLQALSKLSETTMLKALGTVGGAAVDHFLTDTKVKELLHMPVDAFGYDLIIVDLFYTEALLAVGYVFRNVPTIGIVSTNFEKYMEHFQEAMVPIACSPIDYETYTKDIGYWQRLSNIRQCIARRKEFLKYNFMTQEKLISKHFGHAQAPLPNINDLLANLDVVLLNNHVPLTTPRPLLQNTVAAGGLHITRPKELPWNIRNFLDDARTGAIYMNLGNEQLCVDIPKDILQVFFNVFRLRNERVIWTCHDTQKIDDLPKHVLIQHGVLQSDILAHPHVKVFIMNGDLLSVQEGMVRHVPLLGIPTFRNEHDNMNLAVQFGVALKLDYANFTESALTSAIQTLMQDGNYALSIRQVAKQFRDRPLGALETAMYWIDYVLRHNTSSAEIKTRGIGIASNQLHLFDLFVFYFLMAAIIVGALVASMYGAYAIWKHQKLQKLYTKDR